MDKHLAIGAITRRLIALAAGLAASLGLAAAPAQAAMTVSPAAVSIPAGTSIKTSIAGSSGQTISYSGNTAVAVTSLSKANTATPILTIIGKAPGTTTVYARDGLKQSITVSVTVTADAPPPGALTVSPTSLSMPVGAFASATLSGANGTTISYSGNTLVAVTSLSRASTSNPVLTVTGKAPGSATVYARDGLGRTIAVPVTVTPAAVAMTVSPTSLAIPAGAAAPLTGSNVNGALTASSSNPAVASVTVAGSVVTVRGQVAGTALVTLKDSVTTLNVPVTVTGGVALNGRFSLIAWNDLGMHCIDGKDYSMFSILPPFNNLHAQLVNASTGKAITSGVRLTYEAVADPSGSINTASSLKTNFWSWVRPLYGASPAPDVGLTGFATPSRVPRNMALDPVNQWFEAPGLPITPYDDAGVKNYYPTVKVSAFDGTGKLLATTVTVLPVSDEITCAACHASRPATETNTARQAARPAAGWINDPNAENDWKKNILRLHDEKQAANPAYVSALASKGMSGGLLGSATTGTPVLCASCHASNALPGTGLTGVKALTSALHGNHGKVIDPSTMLALDASTNRNACYLCHPGSVTKCLRGAMGNATDASGNATMGCQSCHGNMSKVGDPARVGWLQEPTCQSCHFNGKRTTTSLDAAGHLVKPTDTRFATNPNTPAAGFDLYRFSKGHGGMQCEACHGATHAVYPSSHENDNLQSIALQGYAGTVRECTVCHATVPLTGTGGPHGMHTIGAAWVKEHHDQLGGGTAQCTACHGADYRGSPLAQVKVARSFNTEHGTKTYAAGQSVGCYDCHNGPRP